MKKELIITKERQATLDGLMTVGMLENGLRTADFTCCEDVVTEPFSGDFKVQGMRDGNVYMTQRPKRIRNKAIFRDDNATFSQGQDRRWYFCFSLDEDQLEQVPEKLVRQSGAIAQKVIRELIKGRGYRL
jgi:hypothetical protein